MTRAPIGRRAVVALLAAVLALNAADTGVVGAVVDQLRHTMHIGNTEVGLLTAVPTVVGALATIPVGRMADRLLRVPLLAGSIVVWSLAMGLGALAGSYAVLMASRVLLGAGTATAGPTVASLAGDLFPPEERGALYGRVLAGEIIGAGLGLLVGGDVAAALNWRASFGLVGMCGLGLAYALWRRLPEPRRGGADRLRPAGRARRRRDPARTAIAGEHIEPDPALVLDRDPASLSTSAAVRYVLSIRTNVAVIVASAIGYFFFAGLRVFAITFVQERYGVSKLGLTAFLPLIGLGALGGVLLGGRLTDALLRRGVLTARMSVPGAAYALAALLFLPGLLTGETWIALVMFTLAAAALAMANPPLDAARLDIVHSRLWGRAEAVRTVLRMGGEALAPVLFGWASGLLGDGGTPGLGLDRVFLMALVALVANGVLLVAARRFYPRDVSAAMASEAAWPEVPARDSGPVS